MKIHTAALIIIILFVLLFSAGSGVLAAANPTAEILRENPMRQQLTAQTATFYFERLYIWLLGFVGLAALFAIVYGGVLYIFSGAIESTAEAKRWITNAIIGLVIAGGSYLLLYTINPDLVKKFDIQSIIEKKR